MRREARIIEVGADAVKASAFLAQAEALPICGLDAISGGGGIVVVAPHPDDESLGCGGLIADACASGVDLRLIVVSDGVGSHRNSRLYPPERLRDVREAETLAATAALGLDAAAISFLRLPDAAVPTRGPEADRAVEAIIAAARQCTAGAVCVTWRHDPHCDHEAAATLVAHARSRLPGIRFYEYPIWGWTLPADAIVTGRPVGLRLDVSQYAAAKREAVLAHRSQTTGMIDDDPQGFRLDAAMLDRFAGRFEIYLDMDASLGESSG